ncbi:acyltransferase family protein [uncultured Fibrella sp.]|uniref:acyltransferase family protein n=1 Tax=uncultured Fibrella sp. TaxID=1284596 RepID=UPI0035C9525C
MNSLASPHQQLHGLDHLRSLAIVLVFFFHYQLSFFGHPDWVPTVSKFGWTGVDLFFVLSGFLISSQLFDQAKSGKRISWESYGVKRFFRIVPVYLVVVAAYFFFPVFREKEALPPLWKFLTFTQNLGLNLRDTGTFSHAWSLCVEAHFYLLIPLFIGLITYAKSFNKAYWLIALLFAGGFMIRSYSWTTFYLPVKETSASFITWYKYVYYPTYNRLDGLLVGVTIAGISRFLPASWMRISHSGNRLIGAGLLLLAGAYFLCEDEQSYAASVAGFPLIAVGYGLVVAGAISPSSILFRWHSRVTSIIARISYSIYLTHKGMIHVTQFLLGKLTIDTNTNFTLACCIVACVAAATILTFFVEQPIINMVKNRASTGQKMRTT